MLLNFWTTPPPSAHDPYRPWLTYPGSLTARIIARAQKFRVERRFQGVRPLSRDEATLIYLRGKKYAHVREVILHADETPVVFAHSVAAQRDVKGPWRSIGRLGSRPLAAALFPN